MEAFLQKKEVLINVPDLTTGSDYDLITANPDQPHLVAEFAKREFRRLLVKLDEVHMNGEYMSSPIVKDNIVATNAGVLRFLEEETKPITGNEVDDNFRDLKTCIIDMLTSRYDEQIIGTLPAGFKHLLDKMEDPSIKKSYLLANHASLFPSSTRAVAIIKIYTLLAEEMPKMGIPEAREAAKIIADAANPYLAQNNHWHDIARNDAMLQHWLNFKGGKLYTKNAESLLALHRHSTHHWKEHKHHSPGGDHSFEAVQNLLDHTYSLLIPRCQFELESKGRLRPLKLHKLFTASPMPYGE